MFNRDNLDSGEDLVGDAREDYAAAEGAAEDGPRDSCASGSAAAILLLGALGGLRRRRR